MADRQGECDFYMAWWINRIYDGGNMDGDNSIEGVELVMDWLVAQLTAMTTLRFVELTLNGILDRVHYDSMSCSK